MPRTFRKRSRSPSPCQLTTHEILKRIDRVIGALQELQDDIVAMEDPLDTDTDHDTQEPPGIWEPLSPLEGTPPPSLREKRST